MKKQKILYSDLTTKQLQNLKEMYVQKKIECMTIQDLREFVQEIISHQINDTIGKEEEMEAWKEMSTFFGEQFESIVIEIQKKYKADCDLKNFEEDTQAYRSELLEKNNIEKSKQDMWDD